MGHGCKVYGVLSRHKLENAVPKGPFSCKRVVPTCAIPAKGSRPPFLQLGAHLISPTGPAKWEWKGAQLDTVHKMIRPLAPTLRAHLLNSIRAQLQGCSNDRAPNLFYSRPIYQSAQKIISRPPTKSHKFRGKVSRPLLGKGCTLSSRAHFHMPTTILAPTWIRCTIRLGCTKRYRAPPDFKGCTPR